MIGAERSMMPEVSRSSQDVKRDEEEEPRFGTKCSSKVGEGSNSVDTTFFSAIHPSFEVLLRILLRVGTWNLHPGGHDLG